jgi:hypothetical protein
MSLKNLNTKLGELRNCGEIRIRWRRENRQGKEEVSETERMVYTERRREMIKRIWKRSDKKEDQENNENNQTNL